MVAMHFTVDDLGLLLSVAETILLLFGLLFYVWATYSICTDTLLHANFRMVLCIILLRSVLIPLRRLPTLYWRVFIIGEDTVPFIFIYGELTVFTYNLLCTCVLVLSLERLLYTYFKCCSRSGLIGKAAVIGLLILSNGFLFLLRRFCPSIVFSITFLISAPVVSFILLICVFRTNLRRRKVLDVSNLNEKAEASRSMNAVRIFLPAMFVSCAVTAGLGLLSLVQYFWIKQEVVGSSESKLNNIFGLISAVDSLLTPMLVVVRHKYLKIISAQRLKKEIEQKPISSEEHMKQFVLDWKCIMDPGFDACSVLAIIEFITNCLAQCAMILAVHSIASDKHLHGNFKFVLFLALSRTFLNFIRRSVANYLTLFWIEEVSQEFLVFYKYVSIFTSMLLSISMQLVAVERLLYTYNVANYRRTHASVYSLCFCAAFLILSSVGITLCDNTIVPIAFQFAAPMFTLALLAIVYRANHRRRRPHRSLSLDEKSLANQNMNSVRLFLPPMICSSAFSILHGALTLGKFVALSEEFGYSESIMNAIVGLTIALDDLLTPSIAFFCHRHLKGRAIRRIACELRNTSLEPDDYFKQFEKAWKIGDSRG
ncbi:hypothetical protein PRIPAC_80090 [Pristionchus pacificus]|uniref:G protein-coupled receptor n=1 Tax=Pristionchus pacificus TaxID=54126 RepID=A0A2A6CN18_PRIPA|nr:hypothetical protein PRIPAC_80090 [Pristionchus pacificus]|eukprot:PDM79594.1 G protein-coupled receptor [Pristionchus pacificus]